MGSYHMNVTEWKKGKFIEQHPPALDQWNPEWGESLIKVVSKESKAWSLPPKTNQPTNSFHLHSLPLFISYLYYSIRMLTNNNSLNTLTIFLIVGLLLLPPFHIIWRFSQKIKGPILIGILVYQWIPYCQIACNIGISTQMECPDLKSREKNLENWNTRKATGSEARVFPLL